MKRTKTFNIALILLTLILDSCAQNYSNIQTKKDLAISGMVSEDSTEYSVGEVMEQKGLNGLSVAVFEDYQLIWTETWGVKDTISNDSIDVNTAFSTASIAKPVTATLMALLEEKGMIDLNAPVSKYLKRWQLPENEYVRDTPITIEHLLSHTAGTTQGGFTDFYLGDTIPTLVQSLKGQLPGYDREIEVVFVPGTWWRYSGGGYVIAQMALEDHLGRSLADLAQEHLFEPLEMLNSTMKQPNEAGFLKNVAKAHDEKGNIIRTGIPITPQVAPSGLWSTPTDMAIFLIEIQKALAGKETTVISGNVARRVTEIVTSKVMGGWSIGWERRHGYANYEWFSHGGANTGIGGYIYATMEDGRGIAFFGNGPNRVRFPVLDQLRNSIIKSHQWYRPIEGLEAVELSAQERNRIVGSYSDLIFGDEIKISDTEGKLFISPFAGGGINELIYVGNNSFIIDQYTSSLGYEYDEKDNSEYLTLTRNGIQDSKERRLKKLNDTRYAITFKLTVPHSDDEVFIAGNRDALGNWDPGKVKLNRTSEYERTIELNLRLPIQYKFTRGSWETEGTVVGQLGNENLRLNSAPDGEISYTISRWRDQ